MKTLKSESIDFDATWKDILDVFFQWFMKLFFPLIHEDIDWKQGYESLEQELRKIVPKAEVGDKRVDKLMKVHRKNGDVTWVYIHLEVQSQRDSTISERMYLYNSMLYLRFKKPIMSLVVLGDDQPNWRPDCFEYDLWGCKISLKFPTVKLLDYRNKMEELKKKKNPFAFFVIAHLKTLETEGNLQQRFDYKDVIAKEMLEQGFTYEEVSHLFKFIDTLMKLPDDLEQAFLDKFYAYQEEKNMPILAPFEEIAMNKGIQIGSLREAQVTLIDILEEQFGDIPFSLIDNVNQIEDISQLRKLRRKALKAKTIEEFNQIMIETQQLK